MEAVRIRDKVNEKLNIVLFRLYLKSVGYRDNELLRLQSTLERLSNKQIEDVRVLKSYEGYLVSVTLSGKDKIDICYDVEKSLCSCKSSGGLQAESLLSEVRGCVYNIVRKYECVLQCVSYIILKEGMLNFCK